MLQWLLFVICFEHIEPEIRRRSYGIGDDPVQDVSGAYREGEKIYGF